MAILEDLSRMAMVDVGEDAALPVLTEKTEGWGRMAIMLAASAAVCGLVVSLKRSNEGDSSPS